MKTLMTVSEVATHLRVSKMTVYRLIKVGQLPAVRVGRGYRIKSQAVNKYLSKESMPARGG
jgi:excisionase family DNA binding protein